MAGISFASKLGLMKSVETIGIFGDMDKGDSKTNGVIMGKKWLL